MIDMRELSHWYEVDWVARHMEHHRSLVFVWGVWVPYCNDCSVVLRSVSDR